MLETRPGTASITTASKSNKRLQVKEVSPQKIESKPKAKEMTFSPSRLKNKTVTRLDEMEYSIKDKTLVPSTYSIRDEHGTASSIERNIQSKGDQVVNDIGKIIQ